MFNELLNEVKIAKKKDVDIKKNVNVNVGVAQNNKNVKESDDVEDMLANL
jgi:hypothetical protein